MGNPDSESPLQNVDKHVLNNSNNISTREPLISSAVTFLSDKRIQNQDTNILKSFLLKKGLTDDEISIAFQRVQFFRNSSSPVGRHVQPVAQQLPPFVFPPPAPSSLWHRVHTIVTTITSVAGIFYTIYWLWKTYISPYLFGRNPKRKPVEASLEELESAVGSCVEDLRTVRSSLEALADQRAAELTQGVVVTRIQEVKSEVNSLKSLLLNRNQFPAPPAPVTVEPLSIPAWQLQGEETRRNDQGEGEGEGEGEEEGTGSNGTTNGSDSSLEIVKDPNH